MPGRIAVVKPAACCFFTPQPRPEASSRRSLSTARTTTTNTPNFSSATAGKSSAQTRFEGIFAWGAWPLFCAVFRTRLLHILTHCWEELRRSCEILDFCIVRFGWAADVLREL